MTTSQVIQLTQCVDEAFIARLFAKFRGRFGNLWTCRATCDDDWEFIIDDWLQELSQYTLDQVRAAINKALSIYKDFPPTLGQLVDLCMKETGMPTIQELTRLMVARDFCHPMVKMVYDKIGSWTLTNGKIEEIDRKVKEHYQACKTEFHLNPEKCIAELQIYNSKPKELPAPSKIPSTSESKAFRECMNKCQEILLGKKIIGGGKTYKEFPENQIKPGHREFDQAVFDEYREYLMGIPETETMILPPVYLLERNKFLNMRDQAAFLNSQGYIPPNQREPMNEAPRNGRTQKVYTSWTND